MESTTIAVVRTIGMRGVAVGGLLRRDGVPPMCTFDDPDRNHLYVVEETR